MYPSLLLMLAAGIHPAVESVPFRQPQLAAANGIVAMTFGGGSSIYFAASSDQGRTFQTPVKVAEAGALALGRHRGPRLAIAGRTLVISAIAGDKTATGAHAHGLPDRGNLKTWRSTDGGKTWSGGGVVNDVPGAAREGLHAMAARPDGSLFAVWLDLRGQGTELYGATSGDGGLTWSKNTRVYASPGGTICQCCHPSIAIDEAGGIWIMWRNAVDGSRDLYAVRSSDGKHFEAAHKLGDGTWKLNACPMDGGGFAVSGGQVTSAWRREDSVVLAEPGTAEQKLAPGKDVALARGKDGAYVAWTQEGVIQVRTPRDAAPVKLGPGGFANLVRLEDGSVLAAWEAAGAIETRRLDGSLAVAAR